MATVTTMRSRATVAELREAGQRRAAGAAPMGYRTRGQGPAPSLRGSAAPESPSRSTGGFPATWRAKKTTYNGQELYHLRGIASVVDAEYEMWDMFGPYIEIMDGAAFDKTLAAQHENPLTGAVRVGPDTVFVENHTGLTMARTIAIPGKEPTLLLAMVSGSAPEDNGLGADAYVNPKRSDVANLVTAIEDGNITEMSFRFMIEQAWWSDDFTTFKITEVDIDRGDVSAVNLGANPFTSIGARQREILDDVRGLSVGAAQAAFRQLLARDDLDIPALQRAWAAAEQAEQAERIAVAVAVSDEDDEGDELLCPQCGAGNEADAQYCDQCGASMADATPVSGAGVLNAPGSNPVRANAPAGRSVALMEATLLAELGEDFTLNQ